MTKWIKCTEKMPDLGSQVLGTDGKRFGIFYRWLNKKEECFECDSEERFQAIYWMPMPDLPAHFLE